MGNPSSSFADLQGSPLLHVRYRHHPELGLYRPRVLVPGCQAALPTVGVVQYHPPGVEPGPLRPRLPPGSSPGFWIPRVVVQAPPGRRVGTGRVPDRSTLRNGPATGRGTLLRGVTQIAVGPSMYVDPPDLCTPVSGPARGPALPCIAPAQAVLRHQQCSEATSWPGWQGWQGWQHHRSPSHPTCWDACACTQPESTRSERSDWHTGPCMAMRPPV